MKILALDLGKNNSVACSYDVETHKAEYRRLETTASAIRRLVRAMRPDRVVFEVGTPAGWVYDAVRPLVGSVEVANPTHEGWRWRNVKRKTDRLDALKLARLSAAGQLPTVYMPTKQVREHRALIAYRGKLVARRTRVKNTIRSLLHRQGLSAPSGPAGWTRKAREQLEQWARPLEQTDETTLWRGELYEELQSLARLEGQLGRVEDRLDSLSRMDARVRRLRTIPCVGPRTAELLVAVLDDPRRFSNGRQVASYVGLVPRQYQSGQSDRMGRITKQGHRQLRRMLVEVSWVALRYNPDLREVYRRTRRGSRTRSKIAIVAVARKLLVTAWAMLRDGTVWHSRLRQAAA